MIKTRFVIILKNISGCLLMLLLGACNENENAVYTPVTLYFSPVEDYLMDMSFLPEFVNYPNDWAKFGFRGNVKQVDYNTAHTISIQFDEAGKILQHAFCADGVTLKETTTLTFRYDEDQQLTDIARENDYDLSGRRYSSSEKAGKTTGYTAAGKPQTSTGYRVNGNKTIDYKLQYDYDEKGFCRDVRLLEYSGNYKVIHHISANEAGRVSYIHVDRAHIPNRLTIGERSIFPEYDSKGQLLSVKETGIPKNMEAYKIDSISSISSYAYNKQGDVQELNYSDIVYPSNRTTDFIFTFLYDYDDCGNWITKRIQGPVEYLQDAMNSYYKRNYKIEPLNDEKEKNRGEIVITRTIIYYDRNTKVEKTSNSAAKESKINIPATEGIMGGLSFDDYGKIKRITTAERKKAGIDNITLENVKNYSNREIALGKEIYQGAEGRLATFLVLIEDHATYEYLVSYDAQERVVDCIQTGTHMFYAGDYGTASIEGNLVKCSYQWAEPGSEWGEGYPSIYTITDGMHFKPFSWPPASYPAEAPFMIRGTEEDVPFAWDITSVTCTGTSGNKYKFIVKGKSKNDCTNMSSEERTLRFELFNTEGESVGEAVSVTLPAVKEGESFEKEFKALSKSKSAGKTAVSFSIKR
ncbi:MAG: hypothetical protein LBT83_03795 [Tannerella sp.]|nr:hypothetical protein [Tannerella sp.]